MWFVTEMIQCSLLSQCPGSNPHSFQEAPIEIRENSAILLPGPPLLDIQRKKKTPLLFLFPSGARENDPMSSHIQTHLHTGYRHSHVQHTQAAHEQQGGAEGCMVCWGSSFSGGSFCSSHVRSTKGAALLCWVDAWIPILIECVHAWRHAHTHTYTQL